VIPWLDNLKSGFPDPDLALREPNGLLAAGGKLSPDWLLCAYRQGIFPWYEAEQPILWWTPDPRAVLMPDWLHVSKNLHKFLRQKRYSVTMDEDFTAVIRNCAAPRKGSESTWIGADMQSAYITLHETGHAHSVECWSDNELVGGLYGVSIGKVFFGESMFSLCPNASKIAFVYLVRQLQEWGFRLIDCQQDSPHLRTLGARNIARAQFLRILDRECRHAATVGCWRLDWSYDECGNW